MRGTYYVGSIQDLDPWLERPIATAGWLMKKATVSPATVNKCLNHLESLGIVSELTGRK